MKKLLSLSVVAFLATVPTVHAAPPTQTELEACLGTSGTAMPAFAKVHRGMLPADVAAIWTGADKLDKFGFAKIKPDGCVGATEFDLYYQKDRKTGVLALYSVRVVFDAALTNNADFYKQLVDVLVGKFGPVKDPKDIEKKLLTWGTKDGVAQLTALGPKAPLKLSAPLPR